MRSAKHQKMVTHNILIILRNFKRFKSSFLINLLGLSTGLACALLIYLWVRDEVMMDKFHTAGDRLMQVLEFQKNAENSIRVTNSTPGLLAEKLASDVPEIEYAAVVTPPYWFEPFQFGYKEKHVATRARLVFARFWDLANGASFICCRLTFQRSF